MNSGVRIIKRGRDIGQKSLQRGRDEKTERQSEREIVSTVKSWIAERERRRSQSERSYWEVLNKFAQ